MRITTLLWLCTIVVLGACNSDDKDSLQAVKGFPRGTEWVGVLDRSGYQFAPPADLQFKDNDDFVVYAPHFFVEGGTVVRVDSVKGTITSVEEVDATTVSVVTNIEHYGVVTMTIKDKQKLTGISTNENKPVPFTLEKYEATGTVAGTWTGPIIKDSGPTNGMTAYPDVSTITFRESDAFYTRNGETIRTGPESMTALLTPFKKIGAAVYFKGYDEGNDLLYDYMGVLLQGDTKMMIYSGVTGARLPYYTQTIPWYGTIGQTPVMEKQ